MRGLSTTLSAVLVLAGILASVSHSQAALVSGIYAGTVSDDNGLGLLGQTMVVDFTYDDATPVSYGSTYENLMTDVTVTIGSNVWTWTDTEYSSAKFYDNSIILVSVGEEDRAEFFAYDFSGPSLAPNVQDWSYSLAIYLNDDTPDGNPDGLTSENLPSVVPDPALFQYTQFERPLMTFTFISGDGELGELYYIEANDVELIPEPATMSLLGLGAGLVLLRRRARA
jgi:hypothetical protein